MVAAPTVAAPSYVAPAAPAFGMPQPVSLTAGLVPPPKVQQEAAAYHKAIDAQLNKQSTAVYEEAKIKQAMMQQQATTQIEQYKLQVEEELAMSCLRLDQQALTQLSGLKEAAILQQTGCEERAAIAVGEFNKKKAMEDMAVASYQLQKKWYDQEMKLAADYESVRAKGSRAGVVTPGLTATPAAAPVAYAAPATYAAPAAYAAPTTAYAPPATYAAPAAYAAPTTAYAAPATYAAP